MKTKSKILGVLTGVAFLAVMTLNVNLVNSSSGSSDGFTSLALVELAAEAQGEGGIDWKGETRYCPDFIFTYTTCRIGGTGCTPTFCPYQ